MCRPRSAPFRCAGLAGRAVALSTQGLSSSTSLPASGCAPSHADTAPQPHREHPLIPLQEGFKDVVVAHDGFEYKPDRPEEATFVGQKVRAQCRASGQSALDDTPAAGARALAGCCTLACKLSEGSGLCRCTTPVCSSAHAGALTLRLACEAPNTPLAAAPCAAMQWGWSGAKPGDWAELEFDSREHQLPGQAAPADDAPGEHKMAEVYLTHLKGYEGFGTAAMECVSGCVCSAKGRVLDGTWKQKATLMQIHRFQVSAAAPPPPPAPPPAGPLRGLPVKRRLWAFRGACGGQALCPLMLVPHLAGRHRSPRLAMQPRGPAACLPNRAQVSQHKRCRVRVTVRKEPGAVRQQGHKVTLTAVMASGRVVNWGEPASGTAARGREWPVSMGLRPALQPASQGAVPCCFCTQPKTANPRPPAPRPSSAPLLHASHTRPSTPPFPRLPSLAMCHPPPAGEPLPDPPEDVRVAARAGGQPGVRPARSPRSTALHPACQAFPAGQQLLQALASGASDVGCSGGCATPGAPLAFAAVRCMLDSHISSDSLPSTTFFPDPSQFC